jgi:hypothetical protein
MKLRRDRKDKYDGGWAINQEWIWLCLAIYGKKNAVTTQENA